MVGMKRGITLPEILVAMGLLGLLTGLVYPVMYATVRAMQRSDADVRSQQTAVLLIQKFFADFAYTNRGSMMTLETPPAASFLSREELRENTGLPPLVAVAGKVTRLPVVEGFTEDVTLVEVGNEDTAVVMIRDHPPAMLIPVEPPAAGPSESSITYSAHVPFGLMPLN